MSHKRSVHYLKTNHFHKKNHENELEPVPNRPKTSDKRQKICDNNRFLWKEDNNESIKYICCQKSKNGCPASLTIRTNEPNFKSRYTENNNHLSLSEIEIKLLIRKHELKV